jgi:arabinan endo-1,5-alpha-L-arabinosidase
MLEGDLRLNEPVMIKEGDTYYIFQTGDGVGVKSSKDQGAASNNK